MRTVHKTYKYRIYPNAEQRSLLAKHFGCARWAYNHFLQERIDQYQEHKKSDGYYAQAEVLTKLKKEADYIWLNEVNSQTLQFSVRSVDTAFVNFHKGNARFPRYKSRRHKNTFTVPQFGRLEGGKIYLPKFKSGIKVRGHREVLGKTGKMCITKTPTDKFYVSIFTQQEIEELPKTGKQVGIDLGIKDFAISSDHEKFTNNRYTVKYAKKLKTSQQHLSRKQKGSHGFEKQRLKVARVHEKCAHCREDTLQQVSHQMVVENDIIVVEDLHVKGMLRNHCLARHIADAAWGRFVALLQYKCDWYGKVLVKIDRFHPSSRKCHFCGWIKHDLKLSDREWTCESCGAVHDRDINAAINILEEGLRIISSGTGEYTDGDLKNASKRKRKSVKSEAQLINFAVGGQFTYQPKSCPGKGQISERYGM